MTVTCRFVTGSVALGSFVAVRTSQSVPTRPSGVQPTTVCSSVPRREECGSPTTTSLGDRKFSALGLWLTMTSYVAGTEEASEVQMKAEGGGGGQGTDGELFLKAKIT